MRMQAFALDNLVRHGEHAAGGRGAERRSNLFVYLVLNECSLPDEILITRNS